MDTPGDFHIATLVRRGAVIGNNAKGEVTSAYLPNPLFVDILRDREIITVMHHNCALKFISMRECFVRPINVKSMSAGYDSPTVEVQRDVRIPIADNDYLIVLRKMLRRDYQQVVCSCIDDFVDKHTRLAILKNSNFVWRAFESMSNALQAFLEEKLDYIENQKKSIDNLFMPV